MNRFCSLTFNSKFSAKNRVVVPAMASGTADANGFATDATIAHYARLAASGAGLVFVEYSYVHASGKSEPNQLAADSDEQIEGLRKIARTIQSTGALAGLQLTHSGGKSDLAMTGGELMGPSGIVVPVKGETLPAPRIMTAKDFQLWEDSFAAAVDRAITAGFDLVEFHSAHGYGLNQVLSPITNQRGDEYGKDRAKLLLKTVSSARAKSPSLLLSVRIPGQDFLPGGLTLDDTTKLAQSLERAGVNIINVSSGIGGWRRPGTREGEGYLVSEASVIQARVSIPVIGVGGIETGEYIDQALSEKKFSLAAVGRAILKDPKAWGSAQLNQL